MENEKVERGGRASRSSTTTSDGSPGEERSQVVAGEALLDEREADVRHLPSLLLVDKLASASLEEDVVNHETNVRVDAGSTVRSAEVVGNGLRVDLDAATDGVQRRRGVDERVEELNKRGRLGVDPVGRLDLLQFGENPSFETEGGLRPQHPTS